MKTSRKTELIDKLRDFRSKAIIKELSKPKYRKKGISTNKLFSRVKEFGGKDTFIKRLKLFKKWGLIKTTKVKNRKYIQLTDDVYRIETQLRELQKYYKELILSIKNKWKTIDKKKEKTIFLDNLLASYNNVLWQYGFLVIDNMVEVSLKRTEFQKLLFSYFLSIHLELLEKFIVDLFKNLDLEKILDEKTVSEWKKSKAQMIERFKTDKEETELIINS